MVSSLEGVNKLVEQQGRTQASRTIMLGEMKHDEWIFFDSIDSNYYFFRSAKKNPGKVSDRHNGIWLQTILLMMPYVGRLSRLGMSGLNPFEAPGNVLCRVCVHRGILCVRSEKQPRLWLLSFSISFRCVTSYDTLKPIWQFSSNVSAARCKHHGSSLGNMQSAMQRQHKSNRLVLYGHIISLPTSPHLRYRLASPRRLADI